MSYLKRFSIGFSFLFIFFLGWQLVADQADEEQTHVKEKQGSTLNVAAMDELMAEDLSYTIQLFIHQMKEELAKWKSNDWKRKEIKEDMEKEIADHDHVLGFAHYSKAQENFKLGHIKDDAIEKLTHKKGDGTIFSDPFVHKGKKTMLIGLEDKDEMFVSEIDLSFIESFVKGVASLSDSNGNYFVGGDDTELSLSYEESDSPFVTAKVEDLGWELYVKSSHSQEDEEEIHFKEGELIVKLAKNTNKHEWAKGKKISIIDDINGMIIIRSKQHSTEELLTLLEKDTSVVLKEPNYMYAKQITRRNGSPADNEAGHYMPHHSYTTPNDELYNPYQWNLKQIFAEEGWDLTIEGEEVPIAIVDTGIDPSHIDLEAKIIDGYNTFENNSAYIDENGHGTHVAGVAAAITNNRDGVAGISLNNPILAIKSLDEDAIGSSLSIARGIIWAVDQGAKVINLSLGDRHHSQLMYDAIRYAYDQDVVLIAASGNENTAAPMFPAAYAEVLAVGAVDMDRERAIFSNYGYHLDVSAPGEHIPSTYLGNQYVVMSGTSMAAPHVTGLAGLLRSVKPKLRNKEIYDIIRKTSKDLGKEGYDPHFGFGEIDIEKALKEVMMSY